MASMPTISQIQFLAVGIKLSIWLDHWILDKCQVPIHIGFISFGRSGRNHEVFQQENLVPKHLLATATDLGNEYLKRVLSEGYDHRICPLGCVDPCSTQLVPWQSPQPDCIEVNFNGPLHPTSARDVGSSFGIEQADHRWRAPFPLLHFQFLLLS